MAKEKSKSKKTTPAKSTKEKETSTPETTAAPSEQKEKTRPALFPTGGIFPSSLTKPLEKLNERVYELEELVKSLIGTKP